VSRNIVRGFLSIFGADVGKLLLSLAITPIIVRVLGGKGYGDYAFLLSVLGITMIFVNAGIFDGVRKYVAENREDLNWKSNVFAFYLRVALVVAVCVSGLVVLLGHFGLVEMAFGERYETYVYLVAGLIVTRQLASLARGTLMGFGYEQFSEPLRLLRLVLMAVVGIPLAVVGFGVSGLLAGRLVARTVVAGISLGVVFRQVNRRSITARLPDGFPRRELVSFNSLSVVLLLLTMSLYHVDVLLLKAFTNSSTVGYYKAALVVAEMLWFAPQAFQMVLLHSSSELWSEQNTEYITEIASRTTRYTLLLSLLLGLGLFTLADTFVPLYFGREFEPATMPLLFLLPGTIGFAVVRPTIAISQGKGALRDLIYATGTASVLNLLLNVTLIPRYGMVGAAVGTSVSYGSMFALHVRSARKFGFDPLDDLRAGRIAATAIPTMAIIFALSKVLPGRLLALAVVPPVGFLVYTGLAVYLGALDGEEIDRLLEKVQLENLPLVSPD
jgi:O-antigen/teichoic acid export membrane protein